VRFGVTGHRVLPPTIVARAVEHWRRVLPAAGLHGVSNLAEGADQLFAAHVLRAGGTLEAVLPWENYTPPASGTCFEKLRQAAASVVTMPFSEPSDDAYLAAGQALVDRCDHLFAIWDGRPARGLGGTADVVAYARDRGRPVTVLWVDGITRA
jgi:hypothetical protein